jgi:hypothetical protein
VPLVSSDGVESQALPPLLLLARQRTSRHPGYPSHTSRTSSSVMALGTSLLFLKTSRLAPERRCTCQPWLAQMSVPWTNLFLEQPGQLVATVVYPLAVSSIDYPDERVRLLKVVLPVGAQRLLAADIPCAVSIRPFHKQAGAVHMFNL